MTDLARLRRLPWTMDGRPTYTQHRSGGFVNQLADNMEFMALQMGREMADRGAKLADDPEVSATELRGALALLAAAARDVILVAELRGERLGVDDSVEDDAEE